MEASYQGGVTFEDNDKFQKLSQTIASNIKRFHRMYHQCPKWLTNCKLLRTRKSLGVSCVKFKITPKKLAKDTSSLLMELMRQRTDIPANLLTRERLSDEYVATLNAFQATQRSAAQKTKDDVRKVKAQNINIGDPFAMGSSRNRNSDRDLRQQEQINAQTERDLQQLEERERDIQKLENDILDVNQIFKELGTIIHEQGSVVDSIEASIESTSHDVEAGVQELSRAASYKNKLRTKKMYIALILIVVACIILIVIFHR